MSMSTELITLVDRQHGVATRAQLVAGGLSRSQIEWRLTRGVWRAVLRGVYSVTTGPLDDVAVREAALLAAGNDAVLSHHTAARLWGLAAPPDPMSRIHVTKGITGSCRPREATAATAASSPLGPEFLLGTELHPGVVVHRSRALRYIRTDREQPRTSMADTVVDLAVGEETARDAFALVVRLAASSRLDVNHLRRRLERRRPRRYRTAICDAAELVATGIDSALEAEFVLRVERPFELPTPTRQAPVVVDGSVRYEDLLYEMPGGTLVVRLDGKRFHLATETRFRDRRRDNASELAGRKRLVYGWEDVTGDPAGVAGEITSVLAGLARLTA